MESIDSKGYCSGKGKQVCSAVAAVDQTFHCEDKNNFEQEGKTIACWKNGKKAAAATTTTSFALRMRKTRLELSSKKWFTTIKTVACRLTASPSPAGTFVSILACFFLTTFTPKAFFLPFTGYTSPCSTLLTNLFLYFAEQNKGKIIRREGKESSTFFPGAKKEKNFSFLLCCA